MKLNYNSPIGRTTMNYNIREMSQNEYELLNDFLYEAIFIPEGVQPPPKSIIDTPELQVYIADFGKKKDDINAKRTFEKRIYQGFVIGTEKELCR